METESAGGTAAQPAGACGPTPGRLLSDPREPREGRAPAPEPAELPAGEAAELPIEPHLEQVVPAVRRGLGRARGILVGRGIAPRLVVRGRLDGSTRLPAGVLEELLVALLERVHPARTAPGSPPRLLRIGLRDEARAWHLRIAPVPDARGELPELAFERIPLPIGAPRPAEHVLVRFLAAGGVLRAQGGGEAHRGWFLRLPKPR